MHVPDQVKAFDLLKLMADHNFRLSDAFEPGRYRPSSAGLVLAELTGTNARDIATNTMAALPGDMFQLCGEQLGLPVVRRTFVRFWARSQEK